MKLSKNAKLLGLICCLFTFLSTSVSWGQTTVTYVMQDANFPTQVNDGGDFFNNGATELGMWANTGNKNTVAWRTFKTAGDNTGTNRALQVGDVFVITVAATRAFGQIGFSLNASGTQGTNYGNRTSGSRLYFNTDNYAAWYVNRSGGNSSLSYVPLQTTYKDYRFTVKITSSTTADVFLTVDGTDYRAYNITMNGSGNIDAFSIYGSDMWDGGANRDAYWKQTATVTNSGSVELGYFLSSPNTYTPGLVSNGLVANSTTTSSTNNINVGGDAGSAVILSQANTYTGTTTVNANATLRLGASSTVSTSGPLGTTAAGSTVSSGGVLDMNGFSLTSSATESLTLNGSGISSGGALINSSGTASTWAGAVSLNSNSSIGGSGNLTLSGVVSGANTLTKVGAGTLTLSNTGNTYSGGTIILAGTVSVSNSGNLGNTGGAITLGNGSTTGTLNITSSLSRTTLNITDASSAGVINVTSGQTFTLTNLNTASGTNNTTKIGKSGPGTLTLSGAGTYVGQTQIGEGTVIIQNNNGLGTNNTTSARGIDLGLNVGDVSQANNVSVLATDLVVVPQSIYVAPNTSSATRTIGLSGSGSTTFNNEIYLDGNLTVTGSGTVVLNGRLTNTGGLTISATRVTLQHNANNYTGTTTIGSGSELRLNPSSTGATFTSPIVLNGGSLSTVSIVTNRTFTSSSTLGLSASSTIALSTSAHTLTFAASNGIGWTSGTSLTISGWQGAYNSTSGTSGKIFFGNSSSGLTATQLSQITFFDGTNYYQATLLSTGELVPTSTIAPLYWGGSGTWTTGTPWSLTSGGTANQAWVSGRAAQFDVASSTITGATTNVSAITANENVTFTAGGTIGFGTSGGGICNVTVASGKILNIGNQTISTASGTGVIKNGTGTLQWAGSAFNGGFTLNSGMVAAGGVNALGAGSLTINGGTIAGTANRTFTGKFTGGITIGGNFTLGSTTSPASGTATLLFDNATSLGNSSTRTITLGGTGVISWNGVISGTGSNLVVNGSAVGTLSLGAANTYTGTTTIGTNATLRLGIADALPIGGAGLVLNGGTLTTGATTGFSVGTSSTNAGTLTLSENSTISLGTGNHSIYFAASNLVGWTAGKTLTITGWSGTAESSGTAGKIFIGNSASGLTSTQLAQISINGSPAMQLSTGEIVPRSIQYQSKQSGNWSATSTWERSLDGGSTWVAAVAAPTSSDGAIFIRNGHTVTVDAAISIDETTVDLGGIVIHSSANTVTLINGSGTDLTINGVWRRSISSNTISISSGATISVGATGEYEHAVNGGSIPAATWVSGSTFNVTGLTSSTGFSSGIDQNFSNVTWNCTSQTSDVILDPSTMAINGELKIMSTGAGSNLLVLGNAAVARSLTVGSLNLLGGRFAIAGASASATMNLNVTGNCVIDGGTLQVSRTTNSANTLTVNGTTTISSGSLFIQNSGSSSANSNVNSAILIGDVLVDGGTLDLVPTANDLGPGRVFVRGNLTLSSGAIQNTRNINTGTSGIYFDGTSSQTFTHSGGTISTATGGVGRRFYYKTTSGPTLNEVYNASTAQTTINGSEPSSLGVAGYAAWPTSGSTINNVTINNGAGVTLSSDKQINGTLSLTSGILTTNGNNLILTNSTTGSSSSYVLADATGTVTMNTVSSAKTIPIGTATSYAPLVISAGTSTNFSTYVSSSLPCTPTEPNNVVNLAWGINGSNAPSSVVFQWNVANHGSGFVIGDAIEIGRATCPTYVGTTIGTASGSNPYTLAVTSGLVAGSQIYALGNEGSLKPGDPVVNSDKLTLTALSTTYGTSSTTDNFTVSGASLTSDITITAPAGFEISKTSASSNFADFQTLTPVSGVVSGTVIYVRLKNTTAAGSYNSQTISITSTGATTVNVQTAASGNIVAPKALDITGVSAANKQYDGTTTVSVTANPVFSGLVNGESFSVTGSPTWAFTTKTVGSAKPITQTGNYNAPSSNYTVNQPNLSADITAVTLTVSGATAQNKVYDGTTTATITGGSLVGVIGGDDVTLGGGGTFASANAANGISVTSNLTLGGTDAGNYNLTQPTGLSANISKADQTITFGAIPDKTTADAPFSAGGTASSGLTVSYTSSNTAVATVSGSTITIQGVGTTTITASQAGNQNYNAASDVSQTLNVTLAGYFWNGGSTAANPANGGSGTWSTTNAWRQPSATGSSATWADNNTAILGGSAGDIAIGGTSRIFSNLLVNTSGYSLSHTTTSTLTGNISLNNNVELNLFNNSSTGNVTLNLQGNITGETGSSLNMRATATGSNITRLNLGNNSSVNLECSVPITVTGSGFANIASGGTGTSGATSTFSGNITGNGNRLNIGSGGGYTTIFSGRISNSGDVRFATASSGGAGILVLSGTNNSWSNTLFDASTSATIRLGSTSALPSTSDVVMGNTSGNGGALDLNGFSNTVGSLSSGAGAGSITNNGASSATLTIAGSTSPAAFAFAISNGTGGIALTRSGTGTTELTGACTYTGLTTVSGGTLRLNRTSGTTIPATNNVTISGGTLRISTNQTLNNVTLTSGTLRVDAGVTLTINGTFTGGGTIENNGTIVLVGPSAFPGTSTTISAMNSLTINRSAGVNMNQDLNLTGTLTLTSGNFNIGNNTLTLSGSAYIAGTIANLKSTADSKFIVNISGTTGVQLPNFGEIHTLSLNSNRIFSMSGSLNINNTLNLTNGTLNVNGYTLTLSGTNLSRTTGLILATSPTTTIEFANSSPLSVPNGLFSSFSTINNLQVNGSSTITMNDDFSISNDLSFGGGELIMNGFSVMVFGDNLTRTAGGLNGSVSGSNLFVSNSSILTLPSGLFTDKLAKLTIESPGVVSRTNFEITETLSLNQPNPDATSGLLEMVNDYGNYGNTRSSNSTDANNDLDSYILTLGPNAEIVGSGDVTGKITRNSLTDGGIYQFGNENMKLQFNRNGGTMPTSITVVATKGPEGLHVDKNGSHPAGPYSLNVNAAVKRMYQILRVGGSEEVTCSVQLPYADDELNGNTESDLVTWVHQIPFNGMSPHEQGKTTTDATSNWVKWSGFSLNYIPTLGDNTKTMYWMLSERKTTDTLWIGSRDGKWDDISNWTSGAQPTSTTKVVVDPLIYNEELTVTGTMNIGSMQINASGVVNGSSGTISLNNNSNTWVNNGTFNPGTSTVAFNTSNGTLAGTNSWYNLKVNTGKSLTIQSDAVQNISNNLIIDGIFDATENSNMINFTGNSQSIPQPNGTIEGYSGLGISQSSGNATLSEKVTVLDNFALNNGNLNTTSTNILELGNSVSRTANAVLSAGSVVGPMKRWYNSTSESAPSKGLFPVGTADRNRYAIINFTENTSGGYIIMEYKEGAPTMLDENNNPLADPFGLPIAYSQGGQQKFIQNADATGYWDITPYSSSGVAYGALDNNTFNITLRINSDQIDANPVTTNPPGMRIIRAKGNPSAPHDPFEIGSTSATITPLTDGIDYLVSSSNLTGFSYFNIGGDNETPLPVELLFFNGHCASNGTVIRWSTASEHNSAYFDVEHSRNGETWSLLNRVNSAGFSTSTINYETTDLLKSSGFNYYRLRQVDINGTEKLYNPIVVNCENSESLLSIPNPSSTQFDLILNSQDESVSISIFNQEGRLVNTLNEKITSGTNLIPMNLDLESGVYFIETKLSSGKTLRLKHIIH